MTNLRPLRAMVEVTLGRQRSPQQAEGSHMVRYLRAANVKDGALDLSDVMEMNFTPDEQSTFALRPGDVLVSEGAGSLAAVGASAVWQGELDGTVCFQNTLLRLRPRSGTDARFVAWWARYAYGSGLFASIAGGANIFHLSAERVWALPTWLPPLPAQRAIADFLDAETARIDALIAKKQRMIELFEERFRSSIEMVIWQSDTDPVALGRYVLSLTQGESPQAENRQAESPEFGLLKLSAVRFGEFRPSENKALPADIVLSRTLVPEVGDLLITRSNTPEYVGDCCAVRTVVPNVVLCDLIYRLRLDRRKLMPEYAAYALLTLKARSHLSGSARGTSQSMVKLRGEDVKATPIPIISVEGQARIVAILDSERERLRVFTRRLAMQIDLLSEHRQALITAAVTGDLEVAGVAV